MLMMNNNVIYGICGRNSQTPNCNSSLNRIGQWPHDYDNRSVFFAVQFSSLTCLRLSFTHHRFHTRFSWTMRANGLSHRIRTDGYKQMHVKRKLKMTMWLFAGGTRLETKVKLLRLFFFLLLLHREFDSFKFLDYFCYTHKNQTSKQS